MLFKTLEIAHKDERGTIADVLYKGNYNHCALITSPTRGAIRGNHYHKQSTQTILILDGVLVYWYKDSPEATEIKMKVMTVGDMITTPPFEVHALEIVTSNRFIVFSEGLRGGSDYEADTFRVDPILTETSRWGGYHV
jgi:quercetin dioxygenase-like cupin family protein